MRQGYCFDPQELTTAPLFPSLLCCMMQAYHQRLPGLEEPGRITIISHWDDQAASVFISVCVYYIHVY